VKGETKKMKKEKLALLGGEKTVVTKHEFKWPIITEEEISEVVKIMRKGEISISKVVKEFEQDFAAYHGVKYALAQNNGTAALHSACFAVGVEPGDEVIVPSYTWWATATPILSCNGIPIFCDIDPKTLCADPQDIRRKITPYTKAIIVTHMWGHPCEMDEIMKIAKLYKIAVIEDASHAHGAIYKGRKVGTIGDIGCFSLQGSKPMVAGEGGILITNNQEYYERAVALGHYELINELPSDKYKKYAHTGLGWKYRMHPLAAAIAKVQLKYLDERIEMRRRNLEYLTMGLTGIRGIRPPYTAPYVTRGGWYEYRILYEPEELQGVSRENFIKALQAEGVKIDTERYPLLHLEPLFQERNLYGKGCPWSCLYAKRKVTYQKGDLPVSEKIHSQLMSLPPFTLPCRELLDQYIKAFKKVTENLHQLRQAFL